MKFIPFNIDEKALTDAINAATAGTWGWFYQWGMFIFLLVTLGCLAWVLIDSAQKRQGSKALVPRILSIVGALLVINAVLSFMQERRAAGVVETLRRRLQVNRRRCLRIPAPGD